MILENINIHKTLDIHKLTDSSFIDFNIVIKNCILKSVVGAYLEYNQKIEFNHCKIESVFFQGIIVNNGLTIKNCEILSYLDLSCSRFEPTKECLVFESNIFNNIVSFEDCNFKSPIKIIDNDFIKGSDLKTVKQLGCYYPEQSNINNNRGNLALTKKVENKLWNDLRK